MISKVTSAALRGVEAYVVNVEVFAEGGSSGFATVGLPDTAIKESRDRIQSAFISCGLPLPFGRLVVNLAPADQRKEGSAFDLPIAIGMLITKGIISQEVVNNLLIMGELSLDGCVRPVRGALSAAVTARATGKKRIILPLTNAREAAVVKGIEIYGVENLPQCLNFLTDRVHLEPMTIDPESYFTIGYREIPDMAEVKGQEHAKRALEVAAAGGHNILMVGPPGSGKTMLAKRMPGILPRMTLEEAVETTKIHSVAGLLKSGGGLVTQRPFRAPHHTISDAGLIGGGSCPIPGEVSLSHNGVLFLDELPEFRRSVLEVMRQPLEDGKVTIARALMTVTFPARFMLVAAMNPCPCGYRGSTTHQCRCNDFEVQRYLSRISGPLMDRIDMHIEVAALHWHEMRDGVVGERSGLIVDRVNRARTVQHQRFSNTAIFSNAQMTPKLLQQFCKLDASSLTLLEHAVERLHLSVRAYDRILKLSRTIADLDGVGDIALVHVAEAINYRTLDRQQSEDNQYYWEGGKNFGGQQERERIANDQDESVTEETEEQAEYLLNNHD